MGPSAARWLCTAPRLSMAGAKLAAQSPGTCARLGDSAPRAERQDTGAVHKAQCPQCHSHPTLTPTCTTSSPRALPTHAHPARQLSHTQTAPAPSLHTPRWGHPLCVPAPGQHRGLAHGSARACDPLPAPPKTPPQLLRPGALTVNMLERRLDCLRMGVGVLEAAMVSMRSSRWLMLGVEGTEEE